MSRIENGEKGWEWQGDCYIRKYETQGALRRVVEMGKQIEMFGGVDMAEDTIVEGEELKLRDREEGWYMGVREILCDRDYWVENGTRWSFMWKSRDGVEWKVYVKFNTCSTPGMHTTLDRLRMKAKSWAEDRDGREGLEGETIDVIGEIEDVDGKYIEVLGEFVL